MHIDFVIGVCTRITTNDHKQTLSRCIESINKHVGLNESTRLVIVDSDSPDKSYMDEYRNRFIHIEDIYNRNYEAGAWYHTYKKYVAKRYLFLHDSSYLIGSMDPFENVTVGLYNPIDSWSMCAQHEREWVETALLDTEWKYAPSRFTMVQGSIFYAQRVVLDYLNSKGFYNHLPTNKDQSRAYERYLGTVLTLGGYEDILIKNRLPLNKSFVGRE